VSEGPYELVRRRLDTLERALVRRGRDVALFLIYDPPELVDERPALVRAYFAQRSIPERVLEQTLEAFRAVGAYVELFKGERPFIQALAAGRLHALGRSLMVAYNGIESGVTAGGFEPGRKALIPAVADAYRLAWAHSDAYASSFTLHKFHYLTVLRALGLHTPPAWHYRPPHGWVANRAPARGTKVICKSTYEAWSVGVDEHSVFVVDDSLDERVSDAASRLGQAVTVQQFVAGPEVAVPVYACPEPMTTPPLEVVLARAPGDPEGVMIVDDNLHETPAVSYRRYECPPEAERRLATRAVDVFQAVQLGSFGRVDFRVDERGEAWVIDVANSPGLSEVSSAYRSLASLGFDYPRFLRAVIAATLGARGLLPA
jgi:D-alanine-D-alanine ligase